MKLDEYQDLAQRTRNDKLFPDEHLLNGILGLAGEVGECADLVKKCFYQDGRDIEEKLKDELGDVFWYLVETVTAMGWTLEEVAKHNIEKLQKRYPEGFSSERSLHREE